MKKHIKKEDTITISFILDATLSFVKVYPQIYYYLEHMLLSFGKKKEEDEELKVKYSVTLLRDEFETMLFSNHKTATEDEEALIQKLGNIEFYGGSEDGLENLTGALSEQLTKLEDGRRVLMMFTDSAPSDGNQFPDFISNHMTTEENGLAAAYFYSYEDTYMPILQMVSKDGGIAENDNNVCTYGSLKELLDLNEAETLEQVDRVVEEILGACFG